MQKKLSVIISIFFFVFHPLLLSFLLCSPSQTQQSLFICKRGWSGNRHIYHIPSISVLFFFLLFFPKGFFFLLRVDFSSCLRYQTSTKSRSDRIFWFVAGQKSDGGSFRLKAVSVGLSALSLVSSTHLCVRDLLLLLLIRCTCSCATGQLAWLGPY